MGKSIWVSYGKSDITQKALLFYILCKLHICEEKLKPLSCLDSF